MLAAAATPWAQTAPQQAEPNAPPPVSLSALVDGALALFPRLEGDVLEIQGKSLTLSLPRRSGVQPGLGLEVFQEGREIRHPKTGQLLGRAEQIVGQATVTQVLEGYSVARYDGDGARPGDRVRVPSGKVRVVLVSLAETGVRQNLVEAATTEVYEGLSRTGRFQVVPGDQIALWLAQSNVKPDEFLAGKGVREAAERFKADTILAIQFRQVQRKPFMDVRMFGSGRPEPTLSTAFFVPASVKPVPPGRFSAGDRNQAAATAERKPRSLLARLLGGLVEGSGNYSSAADTIPLAEVQRFPFVVVSMDVSMGARDQIPRMVVTDGERVWVYKIVGKALEADWTYYARSLGLVISVQLADLTGSGSLEVVANRFSSRAGLSSFIISAASGSPTAIVDQEDSFLVAVDEKGTGVKQTLWSQPYSADTFFGKGKMAQVTIKGNGLAKVRQVPVPSELRATGLTLSNVTGKDQRALVFIDESNRLRVNLGNEEIWRSSSIVGGGSAKIEVTRVIERGGRSFFYYMEPTPLTVDLDGDGVQEIVVPQNKVEGGVLGVVYRGPTGMRFQQVTTGFEGGVMAALGAIPGEDGAPPSLIIAVVRHSNFLKTSGETQIIMTLPE